jgi:Uma2 family endonuclease
MNANLTADEFLAMDQRAFGDAWRYEMIDGRIVAQAAPNPDHGAILAGLTGALVTRLRGRRDCRPENGSGAVPKSQQRNTARIPDAMVRCGQNPRVVFEIALPSDLVHPKTWTRRLRDLQAVEGVQEMVVIDQDGSATLYRHVGDAWTYELIDRLDTSIRLDSVDLDLPMAEIYEFVNIQDDSEP